VTRVIVDPGVFVSAFISPRRAAPALLIDAFLDGRFEVVACPALIGELAEVLGREKFSAHSSEGRADAFVAVILDSAEMVVDAVPTAAETPDPDDDYLVALARANGTDAIISGDRHLLGAVLDGVRVWTPREIADQLGLITSA
jgi:uncharacterized protein